MRTFRDYQEYSGATRNRDIEPIPKERLELLNYCLGLAGESGEVVDLLKKHVFHGHMLSRDEVKKELGDVLWYLANICSVLDIQLDQVADKNLDKLFKRYPDGFKIVDSINRKE